MVHDKKIQIYMSTKNKPLYTNYAIPCPRKAMSSQVKSSA